MQRSQILAFISFVVVVLLARSGLQPYDRITWLLEVFPVVLGLPLLWATHRRFPLTTLLYCLLFLHACVLLAGGAYTYARVPIGFQLAEWLGLNRNPYDKIGHFFQGFVPALIAREILIRGQWVRGQKMLCFIVVCIAMTISSAYELVEWLAALILGQGADEFLGTQGYAWDTQSDMFMAFIGATLALLLFSSLHDKQIDKLQPFGLVIEN